MIAPFALVLLVALPLQVRYASCPLWQVTKRTTVWSHNRNLIVAHPVALTASGKRLVAIAGHSGDSQSTEGTSKFGGVVVDESGRHPFELTEPEGKFSFEAPRAVVDSHGRVHIVWGESVADSSDGNGSRGLELWHSRLDGYEWTPPDRVLASRTLEWEASNLDNVAISDDDRLHVVLAARVTNIFEGQIVHLASSDLGWVADTLLTDHIAFQPTISINGRRADIAFISPKFGARTQEASGVWVTALDLDRRVFDSVQLVRRLGIDLANQPHFVRTGDGTLYLFWVESEEGQVFFRTIGASARLTEGEPWIGLPPLPSLPHVGIELRATADDSCDSLHLLVTLFVDAYTTKLVVITLRQREWLPLREIRVGMTFTGRAQWIGASDGTPRIMLSATPWTRAWKSANAPLLWQLFTLR